MAPINAWDVVRIHAIELTKIEVWDYASKSF